MGPPLELLKEKSENKTQKAFTIFLWDDIPLSIRNQPTRKPFKKALHQFYFAQY